MTHQLFVQMTPSPSALLRLISLIHRRGFHPLRIDAQTEQNNKVVVHLSLKAERDSEQLRHQLRKLVDVEHVEVL